MLPKLHEGDVIAGTPYVVVEALGEGGMGTVYEVRDSLLEVNRALKLIDVDIEAGEKRDKAIREVLKEGRVIAKLHGQCPDHIVEVLSMGITNDSRATPYLVMELVRGVTLSDLRKRHGGRLEANLVRQVALEILAALITVHENRIVHRDLKPANIMVEPVPGTFSGTRMKLIDFGITSEVDRRTVRQALTYRYGAPEQVQIEGPHRISAQTDLYALGLILYEAIAGQGPFDATCKTMPQFILAHLSQPAPPLGKMVPGLPRALCEVIDSMLEKDPRKRPASALECGQTLASFDWDFTTTPSHETDKTERDMSTAMVSAILGRKEKQRREKELDAQKPLAKPVEARNAPPLGASPVVVSATLPSRGVADPQPAQRAAADVVVEVPPVDPRIGITRTSPVDAVPVYANGVRAYGSPTPAVATRRFHVNVTEPLPPERDTRGKEPTTFRGMFRTLSGDYGTVKQIRMVFVAAAAVSLLALVLVEAGVLIKKRASPESTSSPTTASSIVSVTAPIAVVPSPAETTTALPVQASTATSASSAAVTPPAPIPPEATSSPSVSKSASHASNAPSSKPQSQPSAAPRATSSSGDLMIDLGDGTKVPMHTERKLPGSGL